MPVAILIQVITVISLSLSSSMLCVECAVRDRGGPDDETGWRWIYAFQARFLSITRESSLQMIMPPLSSMLLINLMIVGHTHSKCDRFFSRIHAALNGHMEQLIDIVVKALRGFRAHFACWAAHDIW